MNYQCVLQSGHTTNNVSSKISGDGTLNGAINEALRQFELPQDEDTQIVIFVNGAYSHNDTEAMRAELKTKKGW